MNWNLFQKLFPPKDFLGIDIGTSAIKIVEVSQFKKKQKLKNYGSISVNAFSQESFRTFEENNNILFSVEDVAKGIKTIIQEAEIKTRKAVFSVPDFSTFFTNFELPLMKKEELEQVIQYEAKQHVPLPLKKVTLSWQIIKGNVLDNKKHNINKEEKLKILLVAVSNEIINQYKEIATLSQLELISLEPEVFSLMRSLIDKNEKEPVILIEIGAKTTTCSIINELILENSYSFDMSSDEFNKEIIKKFNVSYLEAEEIKKKYGILGKEKKGEIIRQILLPLVDVILIEIEQVFNSFYQKEKKEIKKIILAGGAVLLPGLKEYFEVNLKKEIIISQPFSTLEYPPVLEEILKKMGPSYAVAVGAALKELA